MQLTNMGLPVIVARLGFGPGMEFLNQGQTLLAGGLALLAHLLQPCFNTLVGGVARLVKGLPQRGVGGMRFVERLPLIAQLANGFLQFATSGLLLGLCCIKGLGFVNQHLARRIGLGRSR